MRGHGVGDNVDPQAKIATTDATNDLRVRGCGRNSAGRARVIDRVPVSGSSPYAAFDLSDASVTDASRGTPGSLPRSLAAAAVVNSLVLRLHARTPVASAAPSTTSPRSR